MLVAQSTGGCPHHHVSAACMPHARHSSLMYVQSAGGRCRLGDARGCVYPGRSVEHCGPGEGQQPHAARRAAWKLCCH